MTLFSSASRSEFWRAKKEKLGTKLAGWTRIATNGDNLRPDVKQVKSYWLCGNWVLLQDDGGWLQWATPLIPGNVSWQLVKCPQQFSNIWLVLSSSGPGTSCGPASLPSLLPASDNQIKSSLGLVLTTKK